MDEQTHYEGCWRHRGHHRCAIALVNTSIAEAVNLRARLAQAEQEIDRLRAQVQRLEEA